MFVAAVMFGFDRLVDVVEVGRDHRDVLGGRLAHLGRDGRGVEAGEQVDGVSVLGDGVGDALRPLRRRAVVLEDADVQASLVADPHHVVGDGGHEGDVARRRDDRDALARGGRGIDRGPGASNWGSALNASSWDCACSMSAPAAAVVAAPSSSSSPHAARPTAIATIRSRANHRLNVAEFPRVRLIPWRIRWRLYGPARAPGNLRGHVAVGTSSRTAAGSRSAGSP